MATDSIGHPGIRLRPMPEKMGTQIRILFAIVKRGFIDVLRFLIVK